MIVESPAISSDKGALAHITSVLAKVLAIGGFVFAIVSNDIAGTGVSFMWLGSFLVMMSLGLTFVRPEAEGSLEIRDEAVIVTRRGREKVIRKRNVASAWVATRLVAGGLVPVVEIRTRLGTTVSIRLANNDDARAVLRALGFGPGGRSVRIDLARPSRRVFHPLIGLLSYVIGGVTGSALAGRVVDELFDGRPIGDTIAGLLILFGVCFTYAFLKRLFAAPVVTIGHDGLRITRWLRTEVVKRSQLRRFTIPGIDLPGVIELRDGKQIGLAGVLLDDGRLRAAVDLVAERLADEPGPDRGAAFERGGRDAGAWRAQIRASLDPGYRASGLTLEHANEVLASSHSTVEQRLGAALALRVAGEPSDRVRIAAVGAADPRVRVAFEAIAEDVDDEKLDKVLRRLESSPR